MQAIERHRLIHLHPTQMTVGMIEVDDKRRALRALKPHRRRDYLARHAMPAVTGPDGHHYLTDHHHLARALVDEGFEHALLTIEEDYSALAPAAFWQQMTLRTWVHPVDENGHRHGVEQIPSRLQDLRDDPYRSLAGYVRDGGGFIKGHTAFVEFVWADFFRARLSLGHDRADFEAALARALLLARSAEASALPGFVGSASPGKPASGARTPA